MPPYEQLFECAGVNIPIGDQGGQSTCQPCALLHLTWQCYFSSHSLQKRVKDRGTGGNKFS